MIFRMRFATILYSCLTFISCKEDRPSRDYRQDMRDFVQKISVYSHIFNPTFIVIPQNGVELITTSGKSSGPLSENYLNRIDGVAQEDLFFGYTDLDVLTPLEDRNYLIAYLDRIKQINKAVWVIDYCSINSNIDSSYLWNNNKNYISFASPSRELNSIPTYPIAPNNVNTASIKNMSRVKNFLYLINPENFDSKQSYLTYLKQTQYDIFVIDLFFKDTLLTQSDLQLIMYKPCSVPRKVLCYMSIGEAENYRYYWNQQWNNNPPSWLKEENPDWPGNYKVRYWDKEWQNIICGNNQSYMKKIIDAGFHGVYLDIIDAFEYFE